MALSLYCKIILLAFVAFLILWFPVNDGDIGWHLQLGKEIFAETSIPDKDEWTYTAYGSNATYHSWLSAYIFYLIYEIAGNEGLEIFKYWIHIATCLTLYLLVYQKVGNKIAIVLSLVMALYLHRCVIRPHVFTPLFTVIYFYHFVMSNNIKLRQYVFCAIIMLFWVNLHGGFLVGIAITAVVLLSRCVSRLVGCSSVPSVRELLYYFILSIAITFLNPYGSSLYAEITSAIHHPTSDWHSVQLYPILNVPAITVALIILSSLGIIYLIINTLKNNTYKNWTRLFMTLFLFTLALSAVRLDWLLVLSVIGLHESLLENQRIHHMQFECNPYFLKCKYWIQSIPFDLMYILMIGLCFWLQKYDPLYWIRFPFPEAIGQYLAETKPIGSVFCPLPWSGDVTFRTNANLKTFIDGRIQLYPVSFFYSYFVLFEKYGLTESQIRVYDIDYLLLPYDSLGRFLNASPSIQWRIVKSCGEGILLKRVN